MPYGNLSFSITAAQKTAIIGAIATIKTNLPFLINLTKEERKKLRKLGNKRVGYVKDALDGAQANPTVIPSSVDMVEFAKDVQGYADMANIFALLQPLFEGIEDTTVAVGSEAVKTADISYRNLKANRKGNANVEASIAKIASHFKGQGKKKTP